MIFLFATIIACAVLAGGSVLIHYECLSFLDRTIASFRSHRRRLVVTMIGLLMAHILEIWL